MTDKEYILHLEGRLSAQSQQITLLEEKVLFLLDQLQRQGIKKDSHNSSLPPSSDLFPVTNSLRAKSDRKSGGQPGHKGHTLSISSTPDKVIDLKSSFCSKCGSSLSGFGHVLQSRRQVVEIPPVSPIFEEYRQYICHCQHCDHQQSADYPSHVNAPIQYGSSVESLVSYFSVYQYLPFKRLQAMFAQVFSVPLSQGSVGNMLERSAQKCEGVYELIKQEVANSSVVGSDETGAKVNGQKWWLWVWQNVQNTFIVASENRGFKTVESIWKDGLPNATLVSDRWAAQLKATVKDHQLCLAHLLRELIFLEESEKHPFSMVFKELLLSVFKVKKEMKTAYGLKSPEAIKFEEELNQALTQIVDEDQNPKTIIFQRSIIKYRNYILPCLYDIEIPPDNNGSERAIRNVKVKQKVSGQFKTGQQAFCTIRSVIETLIKRRVELLPCLNQIIKLQPV